MVVSIHDLRALVGGLVVDREGRDAPYDPGHVLEGGGEAGVQRRNLRVGVPGGEEGQTSNARGFARREEDAIVVWGLSQRRLGLNLRAMRLLSDNRHPHLK